MTENENKIIDAAEMQQGEGNCFLKPKAWYLDVNLADAKNFIRTNITSAARSFIAIGYYLKHIRDNEMYLEDGYVTVWEFAQTEFGISKSTASRYMKMNDRFSKDGNSPLVDDKYKDFEKSKLQEMLSLTEEQLEQVTPDMKVQQIREMRKPKEIPYYEMEGQMEFEMDFPEIMPDLESASPAEPQTFAMDVSDMFVGEMVEQDDPKPIAISQQQEDAAERATEPLSAYGTLKKVYPEGSMIATEGCVGGHDCFSCSMECGIRQDDRYCQLAPMGKPFPCTTMNVLELLREEIGDRCQFVHHDLAFHRAGDGEPDPCCRSCEESCGYRCRKAMQEEKESEQEEKSRIIDAEFEEMDEPQENPAVIKDYDRRILLDMIQGERETLDVMRDYWEANQPDTLTKYLMKVAAYQMLLEVKEGELNDE